MKVKLEDIIEAMEFAGMETEYYYDTKNERILMLFDGMVDGEDNPELFEDIKEGFVEDYYISLPGQYDINEYQIMEEFIYELPAGRIRMCWQGQSREEVLLEDLRINCMT